MTEHEAKIGLSRIAAGECYLAALHLVLKHQHELGSNEALTILPTNMLAGFALELLLKGYLILNGEHPDAMRRYGHQIDELITAAKKYGMTDIDRIDELVEGLGAAHADFTYRYVDPGQDIHACNWPLVLPVFEALRPELKRVLDAASDRFKSA